MLGSRKTCAGHMKMGRDMASLWKKAGTWVLHRKWPLLIVAGAVIAVAVLVLMANSWQESYFVLPEPEVKPPEVEGAPPPPAVVVGLDKFDILLLGLDSREGEPELGSRSDTILLVTIDPEEKHARILSIPRDTRVRYRDRWRKITEVYSVGGVEASLQAVEDLLDMAIDRYAVVDFKGVIELVDLMGGVVVDVPVDMYKPFENIDLKKGPAQHLNGYDTLAYVRYRGGKLTDMERSERQKEVLLQLVDKILSPTNIFKLPTVARTALSYMDTNVSLQEILALAKIGRTILSNGVENQVLPGINDEYNGGWYYVPFLEEIGLPMGDAEKEYREYLKNAKEAKAAQESQAADSGETGASEDGGEEAAEAGGSAEPASSEEVSGGVEETGTTASAEGAAPAGAAEATGLDAPTGAAETATAKPTETSLQ